MSDFFHIWGTYIGLTLLGTVLPMVSSSMYERARNWLDHAHPDSLPTHSGQWLHEEIQRRKLGDLRILIHPNAEEGSNAFVPSKRWIILSQLTYCKADPTFWAVAAHELGHALTYRASRLLGALLGGARQGHQILIGFAGTVAMANIAFRSRELHSFVILAGTVSLGLYLFVLVDEAIASVTALGILRRDTNFRAVELRAAFLGLGAAFATYLIGFVGTLVFLLSNDALARTLARVRPFVAGTGPFTTGFLAVLVVTAAIAAMALQDVRRLRSPQRAFTVADVERQNLRESRREFGRGVLILAFFVVVWDLPYGLPFVICCVLASRAALRVVAILLFPVWLVLGLCWVLALLPFALLSLLIVKNKGVEETASFKSTQARIAADLASSTSKLAQSTVDYHNDPPWPTRLQRWFAALAALPAVIAFWYFLLAK